MECDPTVTMPGFESQKILVTGVRRKLSLILLRRCPLTKFNGGLRALHSADGQTLSGFSLNKIGLILLWLKEELWNIMVKTRNFYHE